MAAARKYAGAGAPAAAARAAGGRRVPFRRTTGETTAHFARRRLEAHSRAAGHGRRGRVRAAPGLRLPRAVDLLDRDALLAEIVADRRALLARALDVLLTVDSTNRYVADNARQLAGPRAGVRRRNAECRPRPARPKLARAVRQRHLHVAGLAVRRSAADVFRAESRGRRGGRAAHCAASAPRVSG